MYSTFLYRAYHHHWLMLSSLYRCSGERGPTSFPHGQDWRNPHVEGWWESALLTTTRWPWPTAPLHCGCLLRSHHGPDWGSKEEGTLLLRDGQRECDWGCWFSEPFHARPRSGLHRGQLLNNRSSRFSEMGHTFWLHLDPADTWSQTFLIYYMC
jgi:hypothetical protein